MNRNTSKYCKIILGDIIILLCALTNPACFILIMIAMIIEAYYEIFIEKEKNQSIYSRIKVISRKLHVKSATILLFLLTISAILIMIKPNGEIGEPSTLSDWSNIVEFLARNTLFPFYNLLSNKKVIILLAFLIILAVISLNV